MADQEPRNRGWRDIAQEMCRETDPERVTKLCEELTKAMDEERKSRSKPSVA
jgi:hypothetical protein